MKKFQLEIDIFFHHQIIILLKKVHLRKKKLPRKYVDLVPIILCFSKRQYSMLQEESQLSALQPWSRQSR